MVALSREELEKCVSNCPWSNYLGKPFCMLDVPCTAEMRARLDADPILPDVLRVLDICCSKINSTAHVGGEKNSIFNQMICDGMNQLYARNMRVDVYKEQALLRRIKVREGAPDMPLRTDLIYRDEQWKERPWISDKDSTTVD